MAAAAAVATVANGNSSTELFFSHASIKLKLPQVVASPLPRIYEWRTQVTGQQEQKQQQQQEVKETQVECIKQNGSATTPTPTTKAAPTYTPPRIQGNEAKRKNLPQTLGNFFEAERHDSAWNRVTK